MTPKTIKKIKLNDFEYFAISKQHGQNGFILSGLLKSTNQLIKIKNKDYPKERKIIFDLVAKYGVLKNRGSRELETKKILKLIGGCLK